MRVATYWFSRFQVDAEGDNYIFRDMLLPGRRMVDRGLFSGCAGRALDVEFFAQGFLQPSLRPYSAVVGDRPQAAGDAMFWQFPCRTEGAAWEVHSRASQVGRSEQEIHAYLGLPWATFIDKGDFPDFVLRNSAVYLSGLRRALAELGVTLRVHTVCQHIYWQKALTCWKRLGVTDIWLSHAHAGLAEQIDGLAIHPWSLFAVNFEDPARCEGFRPEKPWMEKRLVASFIGGHMPHYLSDVRLKLRTLQTVPGFHIELQRDEWHFEKVVYQHQVRNVPLDQVYRIDESVRRYNEIMTDSVFALCPAGAGPNTLRLWEALGTGCIPVILGVPPRLPSGGNLPEISWNDIVLYYADDDVSGLPAFLENISAAERSARQLAGRHAYQLVKGQRCF